MNVHVAISTADICMTANSHVLLTLCTRTYMYTHAQELRIWSIQHQLCVQSCHRFQPLLPHAPTGFFLHPCAGIVFVGTNQLAALESVLDDEQLAGGMGNRREVVSHDSELCAALYNENFNQVWRESSEQ